MQSCPSTTTASLTTAVTSESVTADRMRSVLRSVSRYDFESENDGAVTVRDRDTMEQVRIPIAELKNYFEDKFRF